jgi:septum formation protein
MTRGLKIVLATTSPQRKSLLRQLGIPFEAADPGEVREASAGEPRDVALGNAFAKVGAVARRLDKGIVVGADTIVVVNDAIMGKARTPGEAEAMLRALVGREHRVLSGLAVADASTGKTLTDVVETRVWMLPLSEGEIESYLATGEPLGKAGGYAIQGIGGALVERVEGDFYNVVGLPLPRLYEMLKEFGVCLLEDQEDR